jgi:hypothetical protein
MIPSVDRSYLPKLGPIACWITVLIIWISSQMLIVRPTSVALDWNGWRQADTPTIKGAVRMAGRFCGGDRCSAMPTIHIPVDRRNARRDRSRLLLPGASNFPAISQAAPAAAARLATVSLSISALIKPAATTSRIRVAST